jgi:hypothetical protein
MHPGAPFPAHLSWEFSDTTLTDCIRLGEDKPAVCPQLNVPDEKKFRRIGTFFMMLRFLAIAA